MYLCPGKSLLNYPINGGETLNVVAFQPKENKAWEAAVWVLPNKGKELLESFNDWAPPVRDVLKAR